jgi:NADP-dependent 3-hydroxy acid dehydrogenase YdfG
MAVHLVTGAGSGIGESVADALAERGDDLVLVARNEERAAALSRRYPRASLLVADLAEPVALADTLAGQRLPRRLDSVVHAAGVAELGTVEELSAAAWRRTLDVNVVAVAELTRLLLPALRAARGQVLLVNSGSGLRANPGWSAYAASKFALRGFAEALRAEEADRGVRVTTIYPGRVATAMQERVHAHEGKDYDPAAWIQPGSVSATVLLALDLPRDAEVTDLTVRPTP